MPHKFENFCRSSIFIKQLNRQLFTSKCFGASAYVNLRRKASATRTLICESSQLWVGRFWSSNIRPLNGRSEHCCKLIHTYFTVSPENPSLSIIGPANEEGRQHRHIIEKPRNHRIQPNKCPIIE